MSHKRFLEKDNLMKYLVLTYYNTDIFLTFTHWRSKVTVTSDTFGLQNSNIYLDKVITFGSDVDLNCNLMGRHNYTSWVIILVDLLDRSHS